VTIAQIFMADVNFESWIYFICGGNSRESVLNRREQRVPFVMTNKEHFEAENHREAAVGDRLLCVLRTSDVKQGKYGQKFVFFLEYESRDCTPHLCFRN